MILGVGFDLVEVGELQAEVDAKRKEWLERVFTATEREYCERQADPYRSFAGTFAAKEGVLKALGTGWTDQSELLDVQVGHNQERPVISLSGPLLEVSKQIGVRSFFVSISHTKNYAAAVVVLES
jgi:holo-[acyl-carrier protein] synthase